MDAETRRRFRVIRANETLRSLDLMHEPRPATYGHAPFCPRGEACCCSGRWVQVHR